jgi:hypothetical protein
VWKAVSSIIPILTGREAFEERVRTALARATDGPGLRGDLGPGEHR